MEQSAKAEIFLCYSTVAVSADILASAKAEIFLCYSTHIVSSDNILSAKAEIFLCYSTKAITAKSHISAKAEIFLCYSTTMKLVGLSNLQKQKFSCVTQHIFPLVTELLSAKAEIFLCYSTNQVKRRAQPICKSRNFLVLLNTYSVIMHKFLLSNTHINHIFCKFFTTLSSNTS